MLLFILFAYLASLFYGMNSAGVYLLEKSDGELVERVRSLSGHAEPHIATFYQSMVQLMTLLNSLKEKLISPGGEKFLMIQIA